MVKNNEEKNMKYKETPNIFYEKKNQSYHTQNMIFKILRLDETD